MDFPTLKEVIKLPIFINRNTFRHLSNRRKVIFDYIHGRPIVTGYPLVLHLELTNKCNLACPMCPRENMNREEGVMEYSLFKKIIDEAAGKIEFIELYLFGEPLLHPDLFRMIEYCKLAGMKTCLSTNVTLLTKDKAHALAESDLDFLTFSLDAVSKQAYGSIRVKANFQKVLDNIDYFLGLKASDSSKHVIVQLIRMDENADEIDKFEKLWRSKGVTTHIKPFITWRGDVDSISRLKEENERKFSLGVCDRIWRHFTVFWDGTVVPCHFMYDKKYSIGNIFQSSLIELWNAPEFVKLRRQHIYGRRNVSVCSKCRIKSLHGWELLPVMLLDTFTLRVVNSIFHYN